MGRADALLQLERHQPHRLLFVLRIVRCAACRSRWPCPSYMDARSALLSPIGVDLAEMLRRDRQERRPEPPPGR